MQDNPRSSYTMYTIGYEGRDIKEFANQLEDLEISTLVDVREIPLSRKRGFSKNSLAQHLSQYGIKYLHIRELGSPRFLRKKLRSDGDYKYFFEHYSKHLESQIRAIEKLHKIVLSTVSCIMCYEKEPVSCHRSIVSQEIVRRNQDRVEIKHITEPTTCTPRQRKSWSPSRPIPAPAQNM